MPVMPEPEADIAVAEPRAAWHRPVLVAKRVADTQEDLLVLLARRVADTQEDLLVLLARRAADTQVDLLVLVALAWPAVAQAA